MKETSVIFRRPLLQHGGSLRITLPPELVEVLNAKDTTELTMAAYQGKYGKYIAIWNEEQNKGKRKK